MSKPYWICPSILAADFARLGEEVSNVLSAGADRVHVDVMDNHYVPNLSFGTVAVKALRKYGINAPMEVHLMVEPVERMIEDFIATGADLIVFHPEATNDIAGNLQKIKDAGIECGLALNPDKPLSMVEPYFGTIDRLLIMSVFPGFGGQKFIADTLTKVTEARRAVESNEFDFRIEMDGGVSLDTIQDCANAGADTFVAGSAIFGQDNYAETIQKFREKLLDTTP